MNKRNYTVQTRIEKPVAEVFNAVVDQNRICQYFTDQTSGPLIEGQQVVWHWSNYGDYPVEVRKISINELIHLEIDSTGWKKTKDQGYPVNIYLEFEALDDNATMLSISEEGWTIDESGLKGSHENCSGWTHMAACLKCFIEHGIDLRK